MIAIPVQQNPLLMAVEMIYNSLVKSGKPIKFYCEIKARTCVNLENKCADCPLKKYQ